MLNKLICWLKGHKRGRVVSKIADKVTTECPRCGRQLTRKARA